VRAWLEGGAAGRLRDGPEVVLVPQPGGRPLGIAEHDGVGARPAQTYFSE